MKKSLVMLALALQITVPAYAGNWCGVIVELNAAVNQGEGVIISIRQPDGGSEVSPASVPLLIVGGALKTVATTAFAGKARVCVSTNAVSYSPGNLVQSIKAMQSAN